MEVNYTLYNIHALAFSIISHYAVFRLCMRMHQKVQLCGISFLIFVVFQLRDIYYREFPISDWPGRFCDLIPECHGQVHQPGSSLCAHQLRGGT